MTFNKEFPASKDSLDLRVQGRSNICHTSVMSHCPKKRPDQYSTSGSILFSLTTGCFILSIVQLITRLSQVLLLTHALIRVKFTRLTMWQIWTISALKTIIILIKLRRYSMPEVTPFRCLLWTTIHLCGEVFVNYWNWTRLFMSLPKRVTGRVRSIWRIALSPIWSCWIWIWKVWAG